MLRGRGIRDGRMTRNYGDGCIPVPEAASLGVAEVTAQPGRPLPMRSVLAGRCGGRPCRPHPLHLGIDAAVAGKTGNGVQCKGDGVVRVDDAERHTGRRPVRLLADTGYVAHDDIIALTGDGGVMRKGGAPPIDFYAPPKPDKADVKAGTLRQRKSVRAREPDAIKAWRARMASEIGRTIAKRRGAIERVNGNLKNRGMGRMMVRGLANVQAVCLLHAIAHNLMTAHRLRTAQPA